MSEVTLHCEKKMENDSDRDPETLTLLDLPLEIHDNIFSHLKYQNISEIRCVCQTFDTVCKRILNQGFMKAEKLHAAITKRLKSQLPRRESERRIHALSRHIDILSSVETRLSLMNMTYMKYIDNGMCCFIPGKVLDEVFKILHFINTYKELPRAHEFLMELRDISSMAMEHFDEKILPSLKTNLISSGRTISSETPSTPSSISSASTSSIVSSPTRSPTFLLARASIQSIVQSSHFMQKAILINQMKRSRAEQVSRLSELRECKNLISEQAKKLREQERKIQEHKSIIARQHQQLLELDRKILLNGEKIMNVTKSLNKHSVAVSNPTPDNVSSCSRNLRSSTLIRTECSKAMAENMRTKKNSVMGRKRSVTPCEEKPQLDTKKKKVPTATLR